MFKFKERSFQHFDALWSPADAAPHICAAGSPDGSVQGGFANRPRSLHLLDLKDSLYFEGYVCYLRIFRISEYVYCNFIVSYNSMFSISL